VPRKAVRGRRRRRQRRGDARCGGGGDGGGVEEREVARSYDTCVREEEVKGETRC